MAPLAGGNVCLCSVVLIEMLGPDKVANAYGIVAFLNGFSTAIGPPLLNKLEHPPVANGPPTDPYSTVMIVSGLVTIASSLLLIGNAINFKAHEPLTTTVAADDGDANANEALSANSVNSSSVSLSLAVPVKGTLPPAGAPSGLLRKEDASKPELGKDTVTKENDK